MFLKKLQSQIWHFSDVIITAPPQFRIEKQEGEQIVFQCEAKKDTKASWFFNGLAVFSDAHNHILQTVLTPGMGSKKVIILSVRHLTYRNSGSYECRGEHPQNRDRRLLSVTTPGKYNLAVFDILVFFITI